LRKTLFAVLIIMVLSTFFPIQSIFAYDNSNGFSINPPDDWIVEEPTGIIAVQFTEPSIDGSSINVAVEETQSSLSQLISSVKSTLATTFEDYNLISEKGRVIGGLDCYELVATFTYEGRLVKAKQVYFVEVGKAFVITCTAIESLYENSLSDFENSISSFRITDSQQEVPTDNNNNRDNTVLTIAAVIAAAVAVIIIATVLFLKKRSNGLENQSQTTTPPPPPLVPS
jgi:hypothetical protein